MPGAITTSRTRTLDTYGGRSERTDILGSNPSETSDLIVRSTDDGKQLCLRLKLLHQKASRALILGQSSVAWSHCREAAQYCNINRLSQEHDPEQARQLCCRLWILYICVLSSLAELTTEGGKLQVKKGLKDVYGEFDEFPGSVIQVWRSIVAAFGGHAGDVDSEVLVPIVLLCLKLRDAKTARTIVETWFATLSEDVMYQLRSTLASNGGISSSQNANMIQASYMRVCELYTLHILPQLNDFSSAYEFLKESTVVSATSKSGFVKRLDSLRNPSAVKKQKSRSTKRPKKRSTKTTNTSSSPASQGKGPAGKVAPAQIPEQTNSKSRDGSSVSATLPALASSSSPDNKTTSYANAATAKELVATNSPSTTVKQPTIASVYSSSRAVSRSGSSRMKLKPAKTRVVVRKRRGAIQVAYDVVRRLMSRWGFTLFTLAIIAAVVRFLTQRFHLPPLLNFVTRKLLNTIKMGTKVTYI